MASAYDRLRVVLLLLLPLAVGLTIGARRTAALLQSPVSQPATPDRWVPFTADVTITNPTTPPVVGRYYRSADGSHRLDTGPSLVELEASSIFNITARRDYIHRPFGDWAVRSVLDAADLKPPKALSRAPVPTLYPYRLAIGKGQSGSLTATVGFSAYQIRWADGTTKLVVPELNLFAVSIRAPNGRTEVYSNIELVEPPASIFRAPADVAIQQLPGRRLMDSRGSTP